MITYEWLYILAGIFFATIIGVIVGLARLSDNWLVRRLGSIWVETLRNVPLLVQIIFYFSVLTSLPRLGLDAGPINGWLHISNKGISMPRVFISDGFYQWLIVVLIGAVAAHYIRRHRTRLHDETGAQTAPTLWALGTIALFALVGLFTQQQQFSHFLAQLCFQFQQTLVADCLMLGSIGVDFRPVQADIAQLEHTQHLRIEQDLHEQRLDFRQKGLAKVGDCGMVWMQPTGYEAERQAFIRRPLYLPRTEHAGRIAVEQQAQQDFNGLI